MTEMTKIMRCTCKHEYQDEKYGEQNRMFVYASKTENHRCTVCGNLKQQLPISKKSENQQKTEKKRKK